ncbi:MAG: hypothetical protein JWM82_1096 [Myxococcales bacterium]|nr:hypothetical protein [Myxococcales bacterium]
MIVVLVVVLGALTTALVNAVVTRHGRAHVRMVAEPAAPAVQAGEGWRPRGRSETSFRPAVPAPAVSEPTGPAIAEAAPPAESAAVQEARRAVTMAVAGHPGTTLTSLVCEPEPCGAVVQAQELRELRAAVLDVTAAYNGHVDVDVRERDDPTLGHVFEATVAVGTPTAETVAALDAEF